MTAIANGFVKLRTEVLSPQHGADVSLVIFVTHVCTPTEDWEMAYSLSGISLGKIGANAAYPASHGREVIRLQSGLVKAEYLTGETPQRASTFINQFIDVKGNFP